MSRNYRQECDDLIKHIDAERCRLYLGSGWVYESNPENYREVLLPCITEQSSNSEPEAEEEKAATG